jgi:hypothetical protein
MSPIKPSDGGVAFKFQQTEIAAEIFRRHPLENENPTNQIDHASLQKTGGAG